jgi:hypothetical protein
MADGRMNPGFSSVYHSTTGCVYYEIPLENSFTWYTTVLNNSDLTSFKNPARLIVNSNIVYNDILLCHNIFFWETLLSSSVQVNEYVHKVHWFSSFPVSKNYFSLAVSWRLLPLLKKKTKLTIFSNRVYCTHVPSLWLRLLVPCSPKKIGIIYKYGH